MESFVIFCYVFFVYGFVVKSFVDYRLVKIENVNCLIKVCVEMFFIFFSVRIMNF